MKSFKRLFFLMMILSQNLRAEEPAKEQQNWRQEMQSMKAVLKELMPYTTNVEKFNAPENAVIIEKQIDRLLVEAKGLQKHQGKFDGAKDPTIQFVAQAFENDLGSIKKSLHQGRRDYARYLVLNTTAYCIECHTRTQSGPQFMGLDPLEGFPQLNPVEKVEYLISTRQFEEAMKLIEQTLTQDKKLEFFGTEKLIRYGLTTSIRYFRDFDRALKIADTAASLKSLPFFLKGDFKIWRSSILELKKQTLPVSIEARIDLSKKWINKSKATNILAQSSHAGDVYLLQANAILLELFKKNLKEKYVPEVLFLIGQTYEMLPEQIVWTLHESYYEACIRKATHSVQGEKCYDALEESILMGYTGSSGTHIPLQLVERLRDLKKMAQ